jgi:hypothetical protein
MVMGRLTNERQAELDRKMAAVMAEFKRRRRVEHLSNGDIEETLRDHNVITTHGYMTYKGFAKQLKDDKVLGVNQWRSKFVCRGLLFLIRHGKRSRAEAIELLAARFPASPSGKTDLKTQKSRINQALNTAGLASNRTAKKNQPLRNRVKALYDQGLSWKNIKEALETEFPEAHSWNVASILRNERADLPDGFFTPKIKNYRDLLDHTADNAHLLGLIWADGSVRPGREAHIRLMEEDEPYLSEVARRLVVDGDPPKLGRVERREGDESYSTKACVYFTIAREHYANYVLSQGKTANSLQDEHGLPAFLSTANTSRFWAFMRGFFEGDGTLTAGTLSFSCNRNLGRELIDELDRRLETRLFILADKSIVRVGCSKGPRPLMLIAGMYSAPGPRMERKRQAAEALWNSTRNKYGVTTPFSELQALTGEGLLTLQRQLLGHVKNDYYIEAVHTETGERFEGRKSEFEESTDIEGRYITRVVNENSDREITGGWKIRRLEPLASA